VKSCARCVFSLLCVILVIVNGTLQISRATSSLSNTIATTTEPIRQTAAYKTLAETLVDALDDSGSAKHAGFEDKEARRRRRQKRLEKAGLSKRRLTEENPECVVWT
jgi:import inner membrane translocase subunit TIM44